MMEIDADLELVAAIENYRDYSDAMFRYCTTHGGPPGSQSDLTSSSGNGKWRTIGPTAATVAVSECSTLAIINMYVYV
jgi:hypothetical protein